MSNDRIEAINAAQAEPVYERGFHTRPTMPIALVRHNWASGRNVQVVGRVAKIRRRENVTIARIIDGTGDLYICFSERTKPNLASLIAVDDQIEVFGMMLRRNAIDAETSRIVAIPAQNARPLLYSRSNGQKVQMTSAIAMRVVRDFMAQQGFMEIVGAHSRTDAVLALADGFPRGYVLTPKFLYGFGLGFTAENTHRYLSLLMNSIQNGTQKRVLPGEIPILEFSKFTDEQVGENQVVWVNNVPGSSNLYSIVYSILKDVSQTYILMRGEHVIGGAETNEVNPDRFTSEFFRALNPDYNVYYDVLSAGVPPFGSFWLNLEEFVGMLMYFDEIVV